jgi:DNA-directed RNA polymerase III subunit RPC6
MRAQSGIAEPIIKKLLKEFEQRKLVKSMKAIGMNKKSYILFNLKAGDNLTGGTFYSHGELDSDFVQALIDFCVDMLQVRILNTQI